VLPVVEALKARPDREKLVPQALWKYFDQHIVVSGWYPERDYFVLIEALAKTVDASAAGGDVWRTFAKFSVQRDIAGGEGAASGPREAKGVYRGFATVEANDPEQFFRRAMKLWSQYHDTGSMQIRGGRAKTNSVIVELVGFSIPLEGFVRLQGYYLEEFGRLIGLAIESKVTRSTARGRPTCEWEYALGRTPATEAFVASLPPLP